MSVTTPPTIGALPTPPTTADPTNFPSRADAFLAALPTLQSEANALASNVYANATDAAATAAASAASAGSAASSAANAAAGSGAAYWANTGATYTTTDVRLSPINKRAYRRLTAGSAGTTDPSVDTTNWVVIDTDLPSVPVTTSTATVADGTHAVVSYAGACALTINPAPAPGTRQRVTVANGRIDVSFDIGAKTLTSRNGSLSGVITMDRKGTIEMKYIDNTIQWVQV